MTLTLSQAAPSKRDVEAVPPARQISTRSLMDWRQRLHYIHSRSFRRFMRAFIDRNPLPDGRVGAFIVWRDPEDELKSLTPATPSTGPGWHMRFPDGSTARYVVTS